jgi:hypothetical protein
MTSPSTISPSTDSTSSPRTRSPTAPSGPVSRPGCSSVASRRTSASSTSPGRTRDRRVLALHPVQPRFDVSAPLVADEPGEVSVATLLSELESPAAKITIVDGVVTDVTVPTEVAERGVVVTDLATAAREHPELVREHLGSLTTSTPESSGGAEDRTVTANDAAWTAGAFVYVPATSSSRSPSASTST